MPPWSCWAAVLKRLGYETRLDLYRALDAGRVGCEAICRVAARVHRHHNRERPCWRFLGFCQAVQRAAKQLGVDPRDVFFELGRRQVVGGQEDLILEVASETRAPFPTLGRSR